MMIDFSGDRRSLSVFATAIGSRLAKTHPTDCATQVLASGCNST
jgi:hypothetical protein